MKLKLKLLKVPPLKRFSNKQIFALMMPIFFEQLMIAGLGIADSYMVSSLGDGAVAAVGLVVALDKVIRQVFVALGSGASVVLAQYIGAKNIKKARESLICSVHIMTAVGLAVSVTMLIFGEVFLKLLFGAVEPEVMELCKIYFRCLASSYMFLALYSVGTAQFRAMGNSKLTLIASVVMMAINLVLKYLFIYVFDMGIAGAGLSTAISVVILGVALVVLLRNNNNPVFIHKLRDFDYKKDLIGRIFKVAIPNAIENGMFQFGLVLLSGLVSTLGKPYIAGNSLANNLTPIMYALGTAFAMSLMIIVSQCMGGGDPEEASFYFKHVLKLNYLLMITNGIIAFFAFDFLIPLFDVSDIAQQTASDILHFYAFSASMFYPSSFALAYGLRGAGDTKFVMITSITSMFALRIAMAFFFVNTLHTGVMGIWYAQVLDWITRSAIFSIRCIRGKWKKIKVI